MTGRLPFLVILALAVLGASSGAVWAHPPSDVVVAVRVIELPAATAWSAASAAPTVPWVGMVVAALVVAAGARRPRRAVTLAIVFVLVLFAFDTGVHSVHHLNDREAGATCAVALGTAHVAATPVDGGTSEPVIPVSLERLVLEARSNVEGVSLAVRQGRAPPLAA